MLWLLSRSEDGPGDWELERVKLLLREESAKLTRWGAKMRAGRQRRREAKANADGC
jgi:hypothetical protein